MKVILTLTLTLSTLIAVAQCGFDHLEHEVLPMGFTPRTGEVVTIPLVFHVMHANGVGNVSDSLLYLIVDDLNEAYLEHDIQFCLATNDPLKRPHSGINRVNVTEVFSNYIGVTASGCNLNSGYINNLQLAEIMHWPPSHAYQIYICPVTLINCSPVGGFAYLPNGQWFDGSYLPMSVFNTETRRKAVSVHEVGHGLGLLHTFQATTTCEEENDCSFNGDQVCDTPVQAAPSADDCSNFACDTDPTNWMDYGWTCADNFTQGQGDRMHSVINNTVRGLAASSGACGCPFDFDGDGVVTVSDLMVFLSLYGDVYAVNDMLSMLAVMGCGG